MVCCFYFFFSSRRRHTRYIGDWSSDVCSSDLHSTSDLARGLTPLTGADIEWLHALVSDWQLLADLSFADLVLWALLRDRQGWVALAQMRPTTGPTTLDDDLVASRIGRGERPLVDAAREECRICREGDP